MQNITFEQIRNVLSESKQNKDIPLPLHNKFHKVLELILSKKCEINKNVIKMFINQINENRECEINIDNVLERWQQIQFIVCEDNKINKLKNNRKGYVIIGKVLSVYIKGKHGNIKSQDQEIRHQLTKTIESKIIRLYSQGIYPPQKSQKFNSLEDLTLNFNLQENLLPGYLGNQVINNFIALVPSIIMTIPYKIQTYNVQFLRTTVLKSLVSQNQLLNKIMTKQIPNRSSVIEGIYFINEGQFQVASGRLVARGWLIKGKCRTSGQVWKFIPLYFLKFIAINQNIWNQFINDIKVNGQYPIDANSVLSISSNSPFIKSKNIRSLTKNVKLPPIFQEINHHQISENTYIKIQKYRHYDDRIQDIFHYKQQLFNRKMKGKSEDQIQLWNIDKRSQKKRNNLQVSRQSIGLRQKSRSISNQNAYILNVLHRIQSISSDEEEQIQDKRLQISQRSRHKKLPIQFYHFGRKNNNNKISK